MSYTKTNALQDALNALNSTNAQNGPEWAKANALRAKGFIELAKTMEELRVYSLEGKVR